MKIFLRTYLYSFFTGIIVFSSCNNNQTGTNNYNANVTGIDSLLGRRIRMADSMEAYTPFKDSLYMDSAQSLRAPYKICAFMNVSCVSCLPDIDKWGSIAADFMKHGVPVMLICYSKDNFEYIKYVFEKGTLKSFPFPLYLDTKELFYHQNKYIKMDLAHQAVLIDSNNTIIATGSPIYSDEVKARYLSMISKN